MKKSTKWIAFGVLTVIFAFGIFLEWLYPPLPKYTGEIPLNALQKK